MPSVVICTGAKPSVVICTGAKPSEGILCEIKDE